MIRYIVSAMFVVGGMCLSVTTQVYAAPGAGTFVWQDVGAPSANFVLQVAQTEQQARSQTTSAINRAKADPAFQAAVNKGDQAAIRRILIASGVSPNAQMQFNVKKGARGQAPSADISIKTDKRKDLTVKCQEHPVLCLIIVIVIVSSS